MVAPVTLVVLSSASGDGLLCCLKYAVSQLLDTGVDPIAVVTFSRTGRWSLPPS